MIRGRRLASPSKKVKLANCRHRKPTAALCFSCLRGFSSNLELFLSLLYFYMTSGHWPPLPPKPPWTPDHPKHYEQLNHFLPSALQNPTTLTTLLLWHLWLAWSLDPEKTFAKMEWNNNMQKWSNTISCSEQHFLKFAHTKKIQKGKMQNFEHVCLEPKSAKSKKKSLTKLG